MTHFHNISGLSEGTLQFMNFLICGYV